MNNMHACVYAQSDMHSAYICIPYAHTPHLVLVAQIHNAAHVHLVESGEHGIRVLGTLQALRHAHTQAGHLHTPACVSGVYVCVVV